MRTWYFSEMAYHPAWEKGLARGSLRVNFPSENLDPQEAGKLLNRYLDEFALCDDEASTSWSTSTTAPRPA